MAIPAGSIASKMSITLFAKMITNFDKKIF
jgi:hypothetical protein